MHAEVVFVCVTMETVLANPKCPRNGGMQLQACRWIGCDAIGGLRKMLEEHRNTRKSKEVSELDDKPWDWRYEMI